ncbi:MAG: hypothetical protein K2J70_08385 [Muribaculaceae bacterium]|nr:hypothetical protein [Muribaculaceae bacterium]
MTEPDIIKFISDGFERAKKGEALLVYSEVAKIQDVGKLPKKSHYPFGWIIYYALHQGHSRSVIYRKKMLMRYLNLSLRKPHKLHSMILTEAIRLYKDSSDAIYILRKKGEAREAIEQESFSLIRFLEMWNITNLREGDWRRKKVEGKTVLSTVEKLITQYTSELFNNSIKPSREFMGLIVKAENTYKDNAALIAQRAEIHLLTGREKEAVDCLKKVILISPSKFFYWHRLASLIDMENNLRLRMALLYKAVTSPGEEEFKGKIRLDLAEGWIKAKSYPQALFELDFVEQVYARNKWNLSPRFLELIASIPDMTKAENPQSIYMKIAYCAEDFIFDALPELETTKTYHKEPSVTIDKFGNKRKQPVAWRVTDASGCNYWFTPERFGISPTLALGEKILVKIHGEKVVSARLS